MNKKKLLTLFITAYLQVLLVSANTYFISNLAWIGIAIAGFGISYLWTINVKKIAISSIKQRLVYSTGAMCGGLSGVVLAKLILNI